MRQDSAPVGFFLVSIKLYLGPTGCPGDEGQARVVPPALSPQPRFSQVFDAIKHIFVYTVYSLLRLIQRIFVRMVCKILIRIFSCVFQLNIRSLV